ncbi:hypothetical protein J6590_082492 [Homalodisca vitripennis]|nr:hypothetical protein J6590_082492 [Homalodisca vitripennis]
MVLRPGGGQRSSVFLSSRSSSTVLPLAVHDSDWELRIQSNGILWTPSVKSMEYDGTSHGNHQVELHQSLLPAEQLLTHLRSFRAAGAALRVSADFLHQYLHAVRTGSTPQGSRCSRRQVEPLNDALAQSPSTYIRHFVSFIEVLDLSNTPTYESMPSC